MIVQIIKYTDKMIADRSALPGQIAFAAQDDVTISGGDQSLASLAEDILSRLNCLALTAARPALPFADFLVQRADPDQHEIIPRDTETRTFLHDIPFLRRSELGPDPAGTIAEILGSRKG
ncbi:MAG: aldolase, partial [Steroidobacteraceae bacterium]|nr:aldolase [Deltaproteobacteria bacterium]